MGFVRGRAYGPDLRERVLAAEGSCRAVALRFGVSVSYVVKARARLRETGLSTPGLQRCHLKPKLEGQAALLRARVSAVPDATLAELREWLRSEHGIVAGYGTLWRTLARLGLTLKKSRSRPANRRGRTSRQPASPGVCNSPSLTQRASSSLMRLGPRPT